MRWIDKLARWASKGQKIRRSAKRIARIWPTARLRLIELARGDDVLSELVRELDAIRDALHRGR